MESHCIASIIREAMEFAGVWQDFCGLSFPVQRLLLLEIENREDEGTDSWFLIEEVAAAKRYDWIKKLDLGKLMEEDDA